MGKLRQSCGACGAMFGVDAKHVGKRVKCPKCGEAVAIVDSGSAAPSSVITAKPAAPKPPVSSESRLPRAKPLAAAPAKPPAAKPAARPSPGVGVPIVTDNSPTPPGSIAQRTRRKSSTPAALLGVLLIGGSLVAVGMMVAALAFFSGLFNQQVEVADADNPFTVAASDRYTESQRGTTSTSPTASQTPNPRSDNEPAENSSGFGRPGQSWSVLVLDLNDRDRGEVAVSIDGRAESVPEIGPVMYSLRSGAHQVMLSRAGYESQQFAFDLEEGGREVYRPLWQRAGAASVASLPRPSAGNGQRSFDDWLQNFEAAKQKAAAENKDILIAFNGTDWCGWCIRLMHEVYFQPAFRSQIDEEFVLVQIDSPRNAPAIRNVENRQRNNEMVERFGVSGFPTVILADAQGQAYAEGGYVEGGVPAFLEAIRVMKGERANRDRLFASVADATGAERVKAAEEALAWMRDNGVIQHYGPTLSGWLATARANDPANASGEQEAFFELDWMAAIATADRSDLRGLRPILQRLEQFQAKHKFVDGDRGARLHLIATAFLAMHEQYDEALKFAAAGRACEPSDPELLSRLQRAAMALANSDVIATGTGFMVAGGGYMLTNYHVVEEGTPYVRLPGEKEPVPAQVVAKDEQKDIALLKITGGPMGQFAPLPVSAQSVGRGARVAVFGYPLSDAVGTGLKLTTGGISALPDDANEGMLLLDCRVNPGNSGGPLCDTRGRVIGMVTAKSDVGFGVDSYGMAQPGAVLEAFLVKHVPQYQPPPADASEQLEWEDVDRRVSGSVLMIVMKDK